MNLSISCLGPVRLFGLTRSFTIGLGAGFAVLIPRLPPTTPTTAFFRLLFLFRLIRNNRSLDDLGLGFFLFFRLFIIRHHIRRGGNHGRAYFRHHTGGGFEPFDGEVRRDQEGIGLHTDRHAIARFDLGDLFTLHVHEVVHNGHGRFQKHLAGPLAGALFF